MNNIFNYMDVSNTGLNYTSIALIITIILIAIILIVLVVKNKSKNNIEILDDETSKAKKENKNQTIKSIPVKNTSIIDDPATVRMSIEEAKADLSNFNVENNNENNENKDDEII